MTPITAQNWRDAMRLHVTAEQQPFVAGYAPIAMLALAKAYVRPMGWRYQPVAFANDAELVGLALLAYDTASTCWLMHFFIDQAHQGQGYGAAAMTQLRNYLQTSEPACQRLCLTVHPANTVAQHLYRRQGFQPTGEVLDGEPVYQLLILPN